MDEALKVDKEIVMKLLHYFIKEKNYNPIILKGIKNEIWLENLQEEYKVVRIVSNHIHNNEQMDIDINRTDRIISKIKMMTFSLSLKVLNTIVMSVSKSSVADLNESSKVLKK